jgi:hypothetical protein
VRLDLKFEISDLRKLLLAECLEPRRTILFVLGTSDLAARLHLKFEISDLEKLPAVDQFEASPYRPVAFWGRLMGLRRWI